jgi:ribosomal protein L7/L12
MSSESESVLAELLALLAAGRKIEAIRRYREVTGAGLAAAKETVEALERGEPLPTKEALDSTMEAEIVSLLEGGKKIQAIKLYRTRTGVGLKEAKDAVEAVAAQRGLPSRAGCLGTVLLLLAVAVTAIALGGEKLHQPDAAATSSSPQSALAQPVRGTNPMLHQQGTRIVDEHGREVHLRGVNLGGWLFWEGWIFGKGILTSQTTILTRLEKAVGAQQTEEFRAAIYENFITEADIQRITRAGFNCVRVPLHRDLFNDRGWKLLDRLLGRCERHQVYVVLDFHALPGGQSKLAVCDPGDARHLVWAAEENQKKTVAIWKAIAARYRKRKIVAG